MSVGAGVEGELKCFCVDVQERVDIAELREKSMEPHLLVPLADARALAHDLFEALRDYAAALKCVKSMQARFRGKLARRVAAAMRERARREALVKQYRDEIAMKRATDAHATWAAEKEAEKVAWGKYVTHGVVLCCCVSRCLGQVQSRSGSVESSASDGSSSLCDSAAAVARDRCGRCRSIRKWWRWDRVRSPLCAVAMACACVLVYVCALVCMRVFMCMCRRACGFAFAFVCASTCMMCWLRRYGWDGTTPAGTVYYVHPKSGETAWEVPVYTPEEAAACTKLQAAARMWRDRYRLKTVRRLVMRERKLAAEEAKWKVAQTAARKINFTTFPVQVLVSVTTKQPKKLPPPRPLPPDVLSDDESDHDSLFDVSESSDDESVTDDRRGRRRSPVRRASKASVRRSSAGGASSALVIVVASPTAAAGAGAAADATPVSPAAAPPAGVRTDEPPVLGGPPAADGAPPVAVDASSSLFSLGSIAGSLAVPDSASTAAAGEPGEPGAAPAVGADASIVSLPSNDTPGGVAAAASVMSKDSIANVDAFMRRGGTLEARRAALAALSEAERAVVRALRKAQRAVARVRRRAARVKIRRAALHPRFHGAVAGRTVIATSVKLTWSVPPVKFGWFKSGT